MGDVTSLNGGTKQNPLSDHARAELLNLAEDGPEPTSGVNPGVVDVLCRKGLARVVQLPSPFPTHKGKSINHLKITDAGQREIYGND